MVAHVRCPSRPRPAGRWHLPRVALLVIAATTLATPLASQDATAPAAAREANWRLAARWAPYKVRQLVHSTSVSPRWIEGTERFWYEWETAAGKSYYLVDPAAGTQRPIFDNDRIAAELTRITRDPWDGQHLPIRSIKFLDANTLQFEVESSQDDTTQDAEAERGREQQDQQQGQAQRRGRPRAKKKVFYFRYDVRSQTLQEIPDYRAPDNHPSWASVAPDGQTIVFVRNFNFEFVFDRHDNLYGIQ